MLKRHKFMKTDGEIVKCTNFDLKFMLMTNKIIEVYNMTHPDDVSELFEVKRYFFNIGFFMANIEYFIKLLGREYQFLTIPGSESLDRGSRTTFYDLLKMWNDIYYCTPGNDTPVTLYELMDNWVEEYLNENELKIEVKVEGKWVDK